MKLRRKTAALAGDADDADAIKKPRRRCDDAAMRLARSCGVVGVSNRLMYIRSEKRLVCVELIPK